MVSGNQGSDVNAIMLQYGLHVRIYVAIHIYDPLVLMCLQTSIRPSRIIQNHAAGSQVDIILVME